MSPPNRPRTYDSLRTVLQRPDVQEVVAKALCQQAIGFDPRNTPWPELSEPGRRLWRAEAQRLLESEQRDIA